MLKNAAVEPVEKAEYFARKMSHCCVERKRTVAFILIFVVPGFYFQLCAIFFLSFMVLFLYYHIPYT